MYKETPLCPQCKAPFHYLYVHRQLDGTVSDYPLEESVVLLKRASWFTEHLKVSGVGMNEVMLSCQCGSGGRVEEESVVLLKRASWFTEHLRSVVWVC